MTTNNHTTDSSTEYDHPHPAVRDAYDLIAEIGERVGADLLTCDRCGHDMIVRNTQVTDDPCKNDVRIKCPTSTDPDSITSTLGIDLGGCGWWTRHGIPISRDEYETEMDRRDHRLVDAVSVLHADDQRTPKQRLNDLGYLDR